MDMEIDASKDDRLIKDEDLFKAAESGDSSIFTALTPLRLSKSLSLRNEDGRSLLHVAVSSAHLRVSLLLTFVFLRVNYTNSEPKSFFHSHGLQMRVTICDVTFI